MTKTIEEVKTFLDSVIGQTLVDPYDPANNGQCVTLIKHLLEFLGAPNPYAARGNATDFDNSLLTEGIAKNGSGVLNICVDHNSPIVNPNYGHIWVSIGSDIWQSNNRKNLIVTKNDLIAQLQQVVNLDQWIVPDQGNQNTKKENEVNPKMIIYQCTGGDVNDKIKNGTFVLINLSRGTWTIINGQAQIDALVLAYAHATGGGAITRTVINNNELFQVIMAANLDERTDGGVRA